MLRGDNTVLTKSLSTDLSMQVPRCFPPASTQFQANMQTPVSEPALLTQVRGWICRPDRALSMVRPLRNCESGMAEKMDIRLEFLLSGQGEPWRRGRSAETATSRGTNFILTPLPASFCCCCKQEIGVKRRQERGDLYKVL